MPMPLEAPDASADPVEAAKIRAEIERREKQWVEINDRYQDKARTGITAVAILVATSVLVIRQCLATLRPALEATTPSIFQLLFLGAAFCLAFTALLFFVVAIDDLDTMFNDFASKFENCLFDFYFFRRSANPRFFGLAILVFSVNLLVALENWLLGCLTLAVSFFIIYSHIFPVLKPHVTTDGSHLVKPGSEFRFQRMLIVTIPFLLYLCHWING